MCFDKTGTLTEEGLDMFGVRVVSKLKKAVSSLVDAKSISNMKQEKGNKKLMLDLMGSCHGLTTVNG